MLELKMHVDTLRFAKLIASHYNLEVTVEQALNALYNYINTGEL